MSATRTDVTTTTRTTGDLAEGHLDRMIRSSAPEQRFRAASVDEALARARSALGDDAEIIEANRIRRGGIGGFFATELGVEIVARSAFGDSGSDVPLELFEADLAMPVNRAQSGKRAAGASPAPSAWAVDLGVDAPLVGPPSMPAVRARQIWRGAARPPQPDARHRESPHHESLPGFEATLAEAMPEHETADQRSGETSPTATFTEHFLRELISDAERLRCSTDRHRMLPVREPPAERTVESAHAHVEIVPPRRRTSSMVSATATEPLDQQTSPAGTRVASPPAPPRMSTPAGPLPTTVGAEPQTLPGMSAPMPMKRERRGGTGTTKSTATRRREAAAAEAPARAMVGELIERCIALTSSADTSTAPTKVALAVTLPDGSVVRLSIDRPRAGRPSRSLRGAAGA